MTAAQPTSYRFLRLKEVKHIVGLGRTAIYDRIRSDKFPKPYSLEARAVGWRSDEIDAWLKGRVVSR